MPVLAGGGVGHHKEPQQGGVTWIICKTADVPNFDDGIRYYR